MRKAKIVPEEVILSSQRYRELQDLFFDELGFIEYLMSFKDSDIIGHGRNTYDNPISNYIIKQLGWIPHKVLSWMVYTREVNLNMGKERFALPEWAVKVMLFSNSKVFDTIVTAKEIKVAFLG